MRNTSGVPRFFSANYRVHIQFLRKTVSRKFIDKYFLQFVTFTWTGFTRRFQMWKYGHRHRSGASWNKLDGIDKVRFFERWNWKFEKSAGKSADECVFRSLDAKRSIYQSRRQRLIFKSQNVQPISRRFRIEPFDFSRRFVNRNRRLKNQKIENRGWLCCRFRDQSEIFQPLGLSLRRIVFRLKRCDLFLRNPDIYSV